MKPNVLGALLAACALSWPASPLMAHHSFAAEFDSNKPVTLTGTITKVEFQNPHIYFYIDVKQADGRVVNYAVEGGTPNQLRRQGWGRDSLKIGTGLGVTGATAKDGRLRANGRDIPGPDGRTLYMVSSGTGAPKDGRDPNARKRPGQ